MTISRERADALRLVGRVVIAEREALAALRPAAPFVVGWCALSLALLVTL